ncbi:MAG: hypothetical protein IJW99_12530 [Clostridia bacterium]|nr:hypothetical protein [Clostridia bacterium]
MSKKSNRAVTLIGVGIIAAAVAVIVSSMLAPRAMAKKSYRSAVALLSESGAGNVEYVSLLDPLGNGGPLSPADPEVRWTEAAEIAALCERFAALAQGARYGGDEDAVGGTWDPRLRFAASEGNIDFYLREQDICITRGNVRWVFSPRDAAAYTAWREELLALLPAPEWEVSEQ